MAQLIVYTGPMFGGKTHLLIHALIKSYHGRKHIVAFKPRKDKRTGCYIATRMKTPGKRAFHRFLKYPAYPVRSAKRVLEIIRKENPDVIGFDEAHFFKPWIVNVIRELLWKNRVRDFTIYVAGLDMDAWGKPFDPMPDILAIADSIVKTTAVCFKCGSDNAVITNKLSGSKKREEVGDAEMYDARCRKCHPSFDQKK